MFIDEHVLVPIQADLDRSVIHGTLRTCDLVPAFMDVIKFTPEYQQIIKLNNPSLQVIFDPTASDNDARWDSSDMSFFLNELLFDILNLYAPRGYYFGSHPGDGSDFGYWQSYE